jgi:hypothetical protein
VADATVAEMGADRKAGLAAAHHDHVVVGLKSRCRHGEMSVYS